MDPECRKHLVEAVVKLRLRDCVRKLLIKPDEVHSYSERINAKLQSGIFQNDTTDPTSDLGLSMIEGEVEMEIAGIEKIVALACLACAPMFEMQGAIAVVFNDPTNGGQRALITEIRSLYQAFPFTQVIQAIGHPHCAVSQQGINLLRTAANERGSPEASFDFTENFDRPLTKNLAAGWGFLNDDMGWRR